MGATLEQDLAINFLDALKNIWSEKSGTWKVEQTDDPLRALTHITIRWLALARKLNPLIRLKMITGIRP